MVWISPKVRGRKPEVLARTTAISGHHDKMGVQRSSILKFSMLQTPHANPPTTHVSVVSLLSNIKHIIIKMR
jgi:hypothetical protein